jgi:NADPH:quinone reductase-like Zn-dependent oxidoreductase
VYAVQIAAGMGAHVTATGLPAQAAFVGQMGAERFIDVTAEAFDQTLSGLDVVLDTVGGATLDRSYGVLRAGGRLVTLGAPPTRELADRYGVQGMFFVVRPDRGELQHLARLVDDGQLEAVVSQTFPLADGRRADESGRQHRRPGKTVLVVR